MKRLLMGCTAALALLGASADAVSASGAPLQARQTLVIRANSAGVQSLGGFHPLRDPTVGAAMKAFGRPSSRQPRYGGSGCTASWRKIGLEMTFAYFGAGGGRRAACQASRGVAKSASIEGPEAAGWRTSRGLEIGDGIEELERRHPSAVEWEGDYWLAIGYSPVGEDSSYPVLAATLQGEVVGGFEVLMSPGYD